MVCEHTNQIWAEGQKVCTDCGLVFPNSVQYIFSYNHQSARRRQPLYSRQKRFYHFILQLGNDTILKHHMTIMDYFGKIEFHYSICPPTNRQYFFNKRVVLFWIMTILELNTTGVHTLKDKLRVEMQLKALCDIAVNFL